MTTGATPLSRCGNLGRWDFVGAPERKERASLFGVTHFRGTCCFDASAQRANLQARRPSQYAGFSQIGASMNAWLPTRDASLLNNSKRWGYAASTGGASCSTYRLDAPLPMRGPWTVDLRWCAVREMFGFALWCNWLLLLGLLRRVGPAPWAGTAGMARHLQRRRPSHKCGNSRANRFEWFPTWAPSGKKSQAIRIEITSPTTPPTRSR